MLTSPFLQYKRCSKSLLLEDQQKQNAKFTGRLSVHHLEEGLTHPF